MAKNRPYKETKRADVSSEGLTIRQQVYNFAASGYSKRSIASKLGVSLSDFEIILSDGSNGIQIAYDAGCAMFEEVHIEALEAIMDDPETSKGLKAKIARENLKAKSEEWAPQTRAVKVTVEKGPTEYQFESFTEAEITNIVQSSLEADNKTNAEKDS
ncbi:hypothetical protein [Leptothrix discophora]|uniref:Terminase small subunit n=1 Tax=Leptothrix discophora TaxID=89 RepID=A0ABT9G0D3_LEPDI|nr:hypothetical protein [Leptothrix discophora]MDP4299918.1 hypothetical protein [Leptothrix discophora]